MKKSLLVAACLVLGAQAHASKARMLALGQDTDGSHYIADFRGVFLNPAWINEMGTGLVNFEVGQTVRPDAGEYSETPANTSGFRSASPIAEGGFIHQMAGWNYGVQLGSMSMFDAVVATATADYDAATTTPTTFTVPKNTVNLMFGGGDALKYGGSLLYGTTTDKTPSDATNPELSKKASTIELKGGVYNDMFDAYVHLGVGGSAKSDTKVTATTTQEAKIESAMIVRAGGGYNLDKSMKVFADIQSWSAKADDGAATTPEKHKYNYMSYMVGMSNMMEMNKEARFFYSLGLEMSNYKNETEAVGTTAAVENKTDMTMLPLTIGIEHDAMSWLVLRASVKQNVLLADTKTGSTSSVTDSHSPNSTSVGAGAGLKIGKMSVDGTLLGTTAAAYGQLSGAVLLANLGMTYSF